RTSVVYSLFLLCFLHVSPSSFFSFFLLIPRPPTSTLFPYTTLFRSYFQLTAPNLLTILSGHGALARNPRRNIILFSAANISFARFLFFPRRDCLRRPRSSRCGKCFRRYDHFPRRQVAHRTSWQPPDLR